VGALLAFALLFVFIIAVDADASDALESTELASLELVEDEEQSDPRKLLTRSKKAKKGLKANGLWKRKGSKYGKDKKAKKPCKGKTCSRKKSKKGKGKKGKDGKGGKGAKGGKGGKKDGRMEIAVQDEGIFMSRDANARNRAFQQAAALGATYVRSMVLMHLLHKCRGQDAIDTLNDYNNLVDSAKANGLKVQMVFTGVAADWGLPRGCTGYTTPTGSNPNITEYKQFIQTYASHFGKKGVTRFSLWNEPNHPAFLCAGKSVESQDGDVDHSKCQASKKKNTALLANLYREGYKVIRTLQKTKQISKDTQILFGEFAGNGLDFFKSMDGNFVADGFSFHPYQYCTPPTTKKPVFITSTCRRVMAGISTVKDVQKMLKKWYKSGKLRTPAGKQVPLYLTEFGYFRAGACYP